MQTYTVILGFSVAVNVLWLKAAGGRMCLAAAVKRPNGLRDRKKPNQTKTKHGKHTVIWPPAVKYTCGVLMWPRLQKHKKKNPNPTKKPYKTLQITRQPVGLHTSKPPFFHHHLQVFLSNVSSAFPFPLLLAPPLSLFHQRLLISKERLLRCY